MNKEKIFIIAGEDSGDLHGAKLVESIKNINPSAEFFELVEAKCNLLVWCLQNILKI